MIHNDFKELILLASLNELDDFNKDKLSDHLKHCSDCREEYLQMTSLREQLISSRPSANDPYLLEKTRKELRQKLLEMDDKPALLDKLKDFFFIYKLAFGGVTLFAAGLFLGLLFNAADKEQPDNDEFYGIVNQKNMRISNIDFIDSDPADGEISFALDAIKPVTVRGSISDAHIQQILSYSLLNEKNDGIRLRTISTIASQKNFAGESGREIKSALIKAVKYDANPGVRREALLLLNRLPFDQEVTETLLYVLENDTNAGIRITAINCFDPEKLKQYEIDRHLINILTQKSREDNNEYIKMRAKTVLEEVNSHEEI